ncbi:MAG TPA: CPXCG motif-containing cysteine-rich protein [Gammaproteobacteria bacterium]|jgi:hypothetical protein
MSDAGLGLTGVEPFEISCPYCGEVIEILIDPSVESQSYIEDCQVCCRPINMAVSIDDEGNPTVNAFAEDEA